VSACAGSANESTNCQGLSLAKKLMIFRELFESLEKNPIFSGGLSLMLIGSMAALLRRFPGQLWAFVERRLSISLDISSRDPAFRWVQTWLASHPYSRRARDLSLTTTWVSTDPDPEVETGPYRSGPSGPASQARFLLSPAPGIHIMMHRRRVLILSRIRNEHQNSGSLTSHESIRIQLLGGSRKLIDELLAEAHACSFPHSPGVSIRTARNDCWMVSSWQPRRPLESLVLADQTLEDLLEDLRDFYRSASWYADRGIPYRRGYLLHGPPGTGKTTLVLAVAGDLKLSVAVLSLSNRLMTDEALRAMVDDLPVGTLLLIEDVDCVFKDKRSTTGDTGVTLSGLLNALDGVSSREGRVLFLTTNHPDRLDPALVRPGRVDRKIELGHATPDQARRLFLWFYRDSGLDTADLAREADRFAAQVPRGKVCMAAVQEHLLRHRRAPEVAAHEVVFEEYSTNSEALIDDGESTHEVAREEQEAQ
jgi:mitochondrial chaperone BCS1